MDDSKECLITSSTSPQNMLKVLLIEDDNDDYVLIKEMLSNTYYSGATIYLAQAYSEALNIIRNDHLNPYDVCLIDYHLNTGTGLDLISEAIKQSTKTPLILLTGHGSYELDLKAMGCGVDDYLDKSEITPQLLERSIRYAIERKRSQLKLIQHEEHLEQLVEERTNELIIKRDKLHKIQIEHEKLIKSLSKALANIQALQDIATYSRDVVLFVRPYDGCILYANDAATTVYGYDHEELLTMSIYDLRTSDALELTAEQLAEAETRGILFEAVHRSKDGSRLPVEVNSRGATIYETRGLVSVIRDITERKQAEAEREKLISDLQEARSWIGAGLHPVKNLRN